MAAVGVRELKNRLSRYLREVKEGRSITVTERGEAVAILVPVDQNRDAQAARELAKKGIGSWGGGKPKGAIRPVVVKGKTVSRIVVEERR
jgi:prevent-host-death family protein